MIDETLPMFADRLKGALVIREARWNRNRGRSATLLGAGRLVADVVRDGRGRHGEAHFSDGGCSYD